MSTLVAGRRPTDPIVRQGTEGAAPGTFDTIGSSINVTYDELPVTQDSRLRAGYAELIETLIENRAGGYTDYNNIVGSVFGDHRDEARIWADVAKLRAQDPIKFARLPQSQEEFEYGLLSRQGRREADKDVVARGGAIAGFAGGVVGAFPDPLNLATLPLGSGKTILQAALRTAGVNAAVEVLQVPQTIAARERLGEDAGAGYLATRIGGAAVGGAVLGSAFKGGEVLIDDIVLRNWDRLPQGVRSRLGEGKWDRLTPDQREQLRGTMTIDDRDLPDIAEAIIGRDNMSIDEKRAVDAMRRDAEIAETSPFKPGPAGDAAHRERLDDAVAKLLQPVQRQSNAITLPSRPQIASPSRGTLNSGSSLSSPSAPPREALKSRIRQAESSGNDNARPIGKNGKLLSSAYGRYQFTRRTWVAYYKRRFGAQGLTDDQIAAKRGDARLQETLMDDLIDDNAAFLRSVGEAQTAGNLYLTHFAGQGGARKLFRADPEASARSVLGDDVVAANPFLDRMSAGDVIAWAHRKMQEPAPRRAGARSELADGEGVWRERLQMEIDRIDAEGDAARAARAANDPVGNAIEDAARGLPSTDHELVPIDRGVASAADIPPVMSERARVKSATDVERSAAIEAALRSDVKETGVIDVADVSSRFEVSEGEIRAVAARLADVEDAPAVAADLIDADALLVARRNYDTAIAAEREANPDVAPPSVQDRMRVDDILGVSTADSRALPVSDKGREFLADLSVDRTGFFTGDDVPLTESIGKRIALADGAQEASRAHLAEAASYVKEMRETRTADDIRASAANDVAFDPSSKWESPTDNAAIEQADSIVHDLAATIAPDDARGFYLDEDGVARSWADIAEELAADAAELEAVRACL